MMSYLKSFTRTWILAGAATIMALTTSCGQNNRSQLKSEGPTKPLLIVMGGFSTCGEHREHGKRETPLGMELRGYEAALRREIESDRGIVFDVILSCYTKLAELRFVHSFDNYKKLHTEVTYGTFIDHLHQQIALHPNTFVIGHSYGGWLAMKTTASYGGPDEHIKTLYSIDPISRKTCLLENPVSWGNCTIAPPDIKDDQRNMIQQVTEHWSNYWQNKTFYLHSSKIDQADVNVKVNASHTEIDNSDQVWSEQLADIRSRLD